MRKEMKEGRRIGFKLMPEAIPLFEKLNKKGYKNLTTIIANVFIVATAIYDENPQEFFRILESSISKTAE